MPVLDYIVVAAVAYLLGSIPTGFLVAKAKGIDIRAVGSGNIGATNAMRVLGKPAGVFVLFVDALKGYAAAKWLPVLILNISNIVSVGEIESLSIVAGICVVLGHNYTCWLKFKGGKGIATTAGVYLALAPAALGIALAVFILSDCCSRATLRSAQLRRRRFCRSRFGSPMKIYFCGLSRLRSARWRFTNTGIEYPTTYGGNGKSSR